MRCPRDQEPLARTADGGERCPRCSGELLERALLEQRYPGYAAALALETDERSPAYQQTTRCPGCEGVMAPHRYEQMLSWVERCGGCELYWLDKADLGNAERIAHQLQRRRAVATLSAEERAELARELAASQGTLPERPGASVLLAYLGLPVISGRRRLRVPYATAALALLLLVLHAAGATPEELGWRQSGSALRLLSASFVHFGWLHLLGNLYFLLAFGDGVEQRVNRGVLLAAFTVLGALSIAAEALTGGDGALIAGASGGVFALIGMAVVLEPRARVLFGVHGVLLRTSLFTYALISAAVQLFMLALSSGQVAYAAHLAGLGLGFALGRLLRGSVRVEA